MLCYILATIQVMTINTEPLYLQGPFQRHNGQGLAKSGLKTQSVSLISYNANCCWGLQIQRAFWGTNG